MIAELLRMKSGGNSFKRVAAYIVNAKNKGKGHPTEWKLASYVIDSKNAGEKVGTIRITNCQSTDVGWAVAECSALAAMNTRSKADRSVHLVVSFPNGEKPTEEQMIDIENEIVASIGFQDHKRISATHVNTDNFHLHIAICAVHPATFNLPTPYYPHYRLQEACIALEQRHGLIKDTHNRGPKSQATERERSNFGLWIEVNAAESIKEAASTAKTWDDLHRGMARHGLVMKPRGAGLVIAHYKDGRSMVKASAVDRGLSKLALEKRFGPYEAPGALGITPERQFTPGSRLPAAETLWLRYQIERETMLAARQDALLALKASHMAYANALKAWYAQRYEAASAQRLSRADRQATRRTLAEERKQDRTDRLALEKSQRDAVRAAHPAPNWRVFLEREAAVGDEAAVQTLRQSTGREVDTSVATENARVHISALAERQRAIRANLQPAQSRDNGLSR